jgi:hypothetical protein
MAAGATAATMAAKEYTPLEVQKIQAGARLGLGSIRHSSPKYFLECSRKDTKIQVQAVMQELLNPDEDDLFSTVQILVTEEMAKDFKNLDFGFNGNASYSMCHWGIVPFMVTPLSLTQASQRRLGCGKVLSSGLKPDPNRRDWSGDGTGCNAKVKPRTDGCPEELLLLP